jgi:hypothetical protein
MTLPRSAKDNEGHLGIEAQLCCSLQWKVFFFATWRLGVRKE